MAAVAAVLLVAVVVVIGLVLRGPGDTTGAGTALPVGPDASGPGASFTASGSLTIDSAPSEPVSGTAAGCDLPADLADLDEGSRLELYAVDGRLVSEGVLRYDSGGTGYCRFAFEFTGVPTGAGPYQLVMAGRGSVTYRESDLLDGIELALGG